MMKKKKNNSRGKINWDKEFEKYQPVKKERPNWRIERDTNSDRRDQMSSYELYISQEAKGEMFEHISFGKKTGDNTNEQGGILLGEVGFDAAHNVFFGNVIASVAAKKADGNPVHLAFTHDDWNDLQNEIDRLNKDREVPLTIIGWYHTHPNELDVFMSGTDRKTQGQWFNEDWHFAVVINPHRKIWRAFQGANADECSGYFYGEELKEPRNTEIHLMNELNTSVEGDTKSIKKNEKPTSKDVRKLRKFYSILFIGLLATGGVMAYLFLRTPAGDSRQGLNGVTVVSDSSGQMTDASVSSRKMAERFVLDSTKNNFSNYLEAAARSPDSVNYAMREDLGYHILTLNLFFQNEKEIEPDSIKKSPLNFKRGE